jgi:hypothetical protein
MRSEEILRREAEYRAVREALGTCELTLILAQPGPKELPEAHMSAMSGLLVDPQGTRASAGSPAEAQLGRP